MSELFAVAQVRCNKVTKKEKKTKKADSVYFISRNVYRLVCLRCEPSDETSTVDMCLRCPWRWKLVNAFLRNGATSNKWVEIGSNEGMTRREDGLKRSTKTQTGCWENFSYGSSRGP